MRHSIILGTILSALFLCAGCEKKIDASSKEAFEKSTKEIMDGMDEAKKEKFTDAIGGLMMKNVLFSEGFGDEAAMNKKLKEVFHGKSADQIIADGEKAKAETEAEMKKLMDGQ